MYVVKYGNEYLHDPLSDNAILSDITISSEVNTSGDCEFTISPNHPLYNKIRLRSMSDRVIVLQEGTILFDGYIDSFETNFDKTRDVKCYGCLSYLGDIRLRPYTTDRSEKDPAGMLYPPATVSGLYNFYIEQYNKYADDDKKFKIGINEGAQLLEHDVLHAASSNFPRIDDELSTNILNSVGGYLFVRHENGDRYIDLFSECLDVNAQIVDFGVNMIDYVRNDNLSDFATAIRPSGTLIQKDDDPDTTKSLDEKDKNIDLLNYPDGQTGFPGFYKRGDVIYNKEAVQKYGYVEVYKSYSDVIDWNDLIARSVADLKPLSRVLPTIEIKAIDLALYQEGNKPLVPGQLVRIRSNPHRIDEYFLLNSMHINISDPSQTTYVLGIPIDTLTGEQSKKSLELDSKINHSLDAVDSLDAAVNDVAQAADTALSDASDAKDLAGSASTKADNAQQTANENKEQINTVKNKQSEHDALIEQAKKDIAASESEISGINDRMTQMDSDIEKAQSDIESTRQEAQKNFDTAKAAADAAQSDADAANQKTSDLSDDLDATKATVSQTVTEFGEVKTTATNAASKADQSLQVSTQASQTATSASQKATSAYNDAQTAITKSSEAVQTANNVSLSLKTDYQTKADADAKYATQASLTATSDQIKSEVSKTYATQATVNALENIANNAVQTWMGAGAPTLANKPASDWNTAALKTQHSGDIYYDTNTGYSYRFGSSDGSTYSWSLIKDTDISKAIADAAKAQKTADSATSGVSELKSSIPVTYATKTELTQKADSITSRVEEVAQAGTTTSSKVTQLEQTASGLQSTVNEQSQKLDQQATTISQVSQRVDSVSSTITQVQGDIDRIDANSQNFITNPQFKQGNADGVANTNMNATDSNTGALPGTATTFGKSTYGYDNRAEKVKIKFIKGHTYRIEIDAKLASDNAYTGDEGLGLFFWFMTADNPGLSQNQYTGYNAKLIPAGTKEWTHASYDYTPTMGDDDPRIIFRPAYRVHPSSRWLVTNFTCTDVTAIAEAQKTADSATSTANSAMSQSSTVQQDLSSFKTTVARTYETKTDASNTKSSLEQSLNGFKTTVSQTYATKTALDTTNGKVTQAQATGDQAIFAALPSLADKTQPNSWLCAIFPTGNGSVQSLPSYSLIASLSASDTRYQADSGGVIQGSGMNFHYGLIRTLVSFAANTTWTFTYSHDDGSRIYVDGVAVFENSNYTANDPVTISFTKGNHIVDIMYSNGWGGYGVWNFSVPLSSIATTMYAPAGASVLASDLANVKTTYSTKSYVDQTSRTVSLGVVEEYKNGQHGSALATQSDITAAKDSITSTVSQTYATKQALSDTDGKAVTAGNKANLALANAQNMVMNTGNDLANTSSNKGVTAENGVYTRTFPGNENHVDFLWGSLSGKAIPGHTYSISLDARVDSGDYSSDDYFLFGWTDGWTAVWARPLSGNWQSFSTKTTVSGSGTNAPPFFMSSYMTSAGSKVVQFRNLSIRDITEVAQLQSDVAATYATQSLVQQTSQQWGVQLNQLSTATDNAIADMNNTLDNQSDALTATSDKIDDEIERRQAYMNFTQDNNGNPLLELGASQNTNKVDITNEKVSFKSEGSEVAYISNKELHINNATIVQKLIIGNSIGFIPRADGHLTLTRI